MRFSSRKNVGPSQIFAITNIYFMFIFILKLFYRETRGLIAAHTKTYLRYLFISMLAVAKSLIFGYVTFRLSNCDWAHKINFNKLMTRGLVFS